jgi:hypothetical protein
MILGFNRRKLITGHRDAVAHFQMILILWLATDIQVCGSPRSEMTMLDRHSNGFSRMNRNELLYVPAHIDCHKQFKGNIDLAQQGKHQLCKEDQNFSPKGASSCDHGPESLGSLSTQIGSASLVTAARLLTILRGGAQKQRRLNCLSENRFGASDSQASSVFDVEPFLAATAPPAPAAAEIVAPEIEDSSAVSCHLPTDLWFEPPVAPDSDLPDPAEPTPPSRGIRKEAAPSSQVARDQGDDSSLSFVPARAAGNAFGGGGREVSSDLYQRVDIGDLPGLAAAADSADDDSAGTRPALSAADRAAAPVAPPKVLPKTSIADRPPSDPTGASVDHGPARRAAAAPSAKAGREAPKKIAVGAAAAAAGRPAARPPPPAVIPSSPPSEHGDSEASGLAQLSAAAAAAAAAVAAPGGSLHNVWPDSAGGDSDALEALMRTGGAGAGGAGDDNGGNEESDWPGSSGPPPPPPPPPPMSAEGPAAVPAKARCRRPAAAPATATAASGDGAGGHARKRALTSAAAGKAAMAPAGNMGLRGGGRPEPAKRPAAPASPASPPDRAIRKRRGTAAGEEGAKKR